MLIDADVAEVAAVVAAVGLLLIGLSPRLTILLAKLPLPPVPTAGAAIDVKDIEPQPSIEGIGAIGGPRHCRRPMRWNVAHTSPTRT